MITCSTKVFTHFHILVHNSDRITEHVSLFNLRGARVSNYLPLERGGGGLANFRAAGLSQRSDADSFTLSALSERIIFHLMAFFICVLHGAHFTHSRRILLKFCVRASLGVRC